MNTREKADIVKHVEQALRDKEWCDIDEQARAAIRATLEYLRENVTREMTRADPGTSTTDTHAFYEATFRAMISAALNDIEGGTG